MGALREIDALGREHLEVKKINNALANDIDNSDLWMKLVNAVEKLEPDGLTRNSDPVMLQIFRTTMDTLLSKYPLFFGYWIRYAEWEFRIAGTEAAEYVSALLQRDVVTALTSMFRFTNAASARSQTPLISGLPTAPSR